MLDVVTTAAAAATTTTCLVDHVKEFGFYSRKMKPGKGSNLNLFVKLLNKNQ